MAATVRARAALVAAPSERRLQLLRQQLLDECTDNLHVKIPPGPFSARRTAASLVPSSAAICRNSRPWLSWQEA
jgi:hypothetical protein